MPRAEPRERLFFALWPDEPLRRRLERLLTGKPFRGVTGRPVPPENYHVTLRYLGPLSESQQACAERVAGGLRSENFRLALNRVGYWSSPRVAWLGVEEVPVSLSRLVESLEKGLEGCGLQPERRPFRPHLTFLRKARPAALPETVSTLVWPVDRFVLVRSRTLPEGPRYEVLRGWSFDGSVK